MTRSLFVRTVFVVLGMSAGLQAYAGSEMLDIDSRFRAKIAKEKIRAGAQEREAEARGQSLNDRSRCGSQSIGNIDTGGRIGTQPREVFVFAPNAINIVGRGSCN